MAFSWKKVANPPALDEVEVTVIGPGFGECIVVHTGNGRWLIVDSCRDPATKQPVALLYLRALGIDPTVSVDWIVATHWHADHVGGIHELVTACSNAQFFCASVLNEREFLRYAAQSRAVAGAKKGGEFLDTLRTLKLRNHQVKWTQGGRGLATRSSFNGNHSFRMDSLSPSDREYQLFLDQIIPKIAVKGTPHRAATARDPNRAAIVLSLQWGRDAVLLGADLVTDPDSNLGWLAAVSEASTLAVGRASLVKIPHHGSAGAHCPKMWTDLLTDLPVSVITPFRCGGSGRPPPKSSDLARISKLSSRTVLTAPSNSGRGRKPSSAIAAGLAQSGIKMHTRRPKVGIARLRRYGQGRWNIQLFGQAKRITPAKAQKPRQRGRRRQKRG